MQQLTLDDALEQLRLAYLSGDSERIEYAEKAVDKLDVPKEPPTLLGAALWYAEQGLPVFAVQAGGKVPYPGTHGCKDATTDPDIVRAMWGERPGSNVAIATGHLVDVVDIDGPLGQAQRAKNWDDIFGQVDADNVGKVLTPRHGGMHIYVPATGDSNSANIVPGVDYRGLGGYVLAPPSVIHPGGKDTPGTYQWLGEPHFDQLGSDAAA